MKAETKPIFEEGVQHYRGNSFDEAVSSFKRALEVDPECWDARFYLAMIYTRQGKAREAKQEFVTIRDMAPDAEMRKRAVSALSAMSIAG